MLGCSDGTGHFPSSRLEDLFQGFRSSIVVQCLLKVQCCFYMLLLGEFRQVLVNVVETRVSYESGNLFWFSTCCNILMHVGVPDVMSCEGFARDILHECFQSLLEPSSSNTKKLVIESKSFLFH